MRSNEKNAIVETLERRSQAHRRAGHRRISSTEMDATILEPPWSSPLPRNEVDLGERMGEGVAIVIRSELNRRSEFQRVSCRLVAARMQMAMSRSWGRKTGGRRRGTDVMYRRRYVFRMQSSEWNARKEASRSTRMWEGDS